MTGKIAKGKNGSKKAPTIILVDDEKAILRALQRLFRNENFNVISSCSGVEALEILSKCGKRISLIITDQQMPNMTGLQFLERVKVILPDSIRFLLTGYTEMKLIREGLEKGTIHKYIFKPWNDEQLLLLVRSVMARRGRSDNSTTHG